MAPKGSGGRVPRDLCSKLELLVVGGGGEVRVN